METKGASACICPRDNTTLRRLSVDPKCAMPTHNWDDVQQELDLILGRA